MTQTKSIFLLGATGYIGGSILKVLLDRKHQFSVTALVRTESKIPILTALGVKVVKGSLDDVETIKHTAYQHDVVINTADCDHLESAQAIVKAIQQQYKDTGKKIIYIHTSGTALVAEDTKGNSTSTKIYDDCNEKEISEIPATNPHRHVDTFLYKELPPASFPLIIIAPSAIYGVGETNNGASNNVTIIAPVLVRAGVNNRQVPQIGKGLAMWSTVSIQDTTDFFILALEKALKGELTSELLGYYYLGSGESTFHQISKTIGEVLVKKGLADTAEPREINDEQEAIKAFAFPYAAFLGVNSRIVSNKAKKIGWQPKYTDMLKSLVDEDVETILAKN